MGTWRCLAPSASTRKVSSKLNQFPLLRYSHTSSIRLMEKFKVFTAFYHLSELRSREDLIKGIIENLDYNMYVNFGTP